MVIQAIVRIQTTMSPDASKQGFFISRLRASHNVARGIIRYAVVEGESWTQIRKILNNFQIGACSYACKETVQAWHQDIGRTPGRFTYIHESHIPVSAMFGRTNEPGPDEAAPMFRTRIFVPWLWRQPDAGLQEGIKGIEIG